MKTIIVKMKVGDDVMRHIKKIQEHADVISTKIILEKHKDGYTFKYLDVE